MTLARPVLMYGSEAWTIRIPDEERLRAEDVKFTRKTAGFTLLHHKRNEEVLKSFKVESVSKFIQNYSASWMTFKEWILTEFQTNFCTTDHMEKEA